MTATNRSTEGRVQGAEGRRPSAGRNTRWTREQIRAARLAPLVPLLQRRGLQLIERPGGNFEVAAYKGLLLKDSYWRWPDRNLAGNAIDFFVQVLGLSFHDTMHQITTP
jgi:hypothetical protein